MNLITRFYACFTLGSAVFAIVFMLCSLSGCNKAHEESMDFQFAQNNQQEKL